MHSIGYINSQINAVILNFLYIKESWKQISNMVSTKIFSSTIFQLFNKKMFLPNLHFLISS